MKSILVANAKGGVGKTTTAFTLASAMAARGTRTALADADRQQSALRWLSMRPADANRIEALNWIKGKRIGDAPKGLDWLVIDAPGAIRGEKAEMLAAEADIIVTPVAPSPIDIRATESFIAAMEELKRVRKGKAQLLVIGNRARRGRVTEQLQAHFATLGRPLSAVIPDRAAYADLAGGGMAVFDRNTKPLRTLQEDWLPLLDALSA